MKNTIFKNYLIFIAVLFASGTALFLLLETANREIEIIDDRVELTHRVIIESEQLNTLVARMVSSQREYLISADSTFLEEYYQRKSSFSEQLTKLNKMTVGNTSQQRRLAEMQPYFFNLYTQLEKSAAEGLPFVSQNILDDADLIHNNKNEIFRLNKAFLEEEHGYLNQWVQNVKSQKNQYFYTLIFGGSIAVILLMMFNGYLLKTQLARSMAQKALDEKEEIFRLAVEGTQDGIFDWNIKTNEVFYSAQFTKMLGYEPSDFSGTFDDFIHILHPEEKGNVLEYLNYYLDGQLAEYSNIFRVRHKSGLWLWVHSRGKMILDDQGRPSRFVGANSDINAAKEYERKLDEARIKAEKANRAKSDFLAHMSHEIRTPLTTINGVAEIMVQEYQTFDPKKQQLISVLHNSAVTLMDLIQDILDFSKIESGEIELEEKAFNLGGVIEQIVSVMSIRAKEKNLAISFDYETVKDIIFLGDITRIRQILINLIGNAIKFTDHGHVSVAIKQDKKNDLDVLRFDIEDTGIGIKEDQRDLIFEHFKQADTSIARKFGGTGLGLAISQRLANIMDGNIHVTSTLGEGSLFSLFLPLKTVKEGMPSSVSQPQRERINERLAALASTHNKIMLVEDYEGNIVFLSYILEGMSCDFDVARTGHEAISLWRENHYDLILMDVQMPEMDGFTATQKIRQLETDQQLPPTPIIGMTAHALVGDQNKCIEAGMNSYLAKPIVEMDLKSSILDVLSHKKTT